MAEEVRRARDATEINAKLRDLSAQIFPEHLYLCYVHVDELREQDVNPRSMPKRMFDQLAENIRNEATLESVPLCAKTDQGIEIISGHHRVRAAREAGVEQILVLVYDNLSRSRIAAKQLAHNTISGQDDPELVRRVFERIVEVQAKFEAYVDPRTFSLAPEPARFRQVDVDLGALSETVLVVFLASQKIDFDAAVEAIMPKCDLDAVYLAQKEVYDGWRDAFNRVREELDIVSAPTAIAQMARLALEALDRRAAEANRAANRMAE